MIETQFTLYLENRPGALLRVTSKLAEAKINVVGISAATGADVGLVQVVTSDSRKARQVLKAGKIAFTTQKVALIEARNVPGILSKGLARLAKAGINVNYVYGTTASDADTCGLILSAPDLKAAEKAWGEW